MKEEVQRVSGFQAEHPVNISGAGVQRLIRIFRKLFQKRLGTRREFLIGFVNRGKFVISQHLFDVLCLDKINAFLRDNLEGDIVGSPKGPLDLHFFAGPLVVHIFSYFT